MLISVVIPTYNAAPFIRETLESVFAQTRLPIEVIVVDDCSPDDTAAIVEEIAKAAPVPLSVIGLPKNTGGPARPLNVGIGAARGDYMATLDQDDLFGPTKLEEQSALLAAHPTLGLIFGTLQFEGWDADYNRKVEGWFESGLSSIPMHPLSPGGYRIDSADAVSGILRSLCFVMTCSNMLFPKAVWSECGGFNTGTTVSCDLAFLAAVCARYDIGFVPSHSASWRLHPTSFYRTAPLAVRIQDQLKVYSDLAKIALPATAADELRRLTRSTAFDGAFALRNAGRHFLAAECLWRAIRMTGPWPAGVGALAKLAPHWAGTRVVGKPARGAEKPGARGE